MLRLRDYQRASLDALSAAWARGGADDAAPGAATGATSSLNRTVVAAAGLLAVALAAATVLL